MSARSKGNQTETRAEAELVAEGFRVHRSRQTGFRTTKGLWLSRSNDVYGVFDLIAARGGFKRWISVTTGSNNASLRRRALEAMAPSIESPYDRVELWVWNAGRPTKRSRVRQKWTKKTFDSATSAWRDLADSQPWLPLDPSPASTNCGSPSDLPASPLLAQSGSPRLANSG